MTAIYDRSNFILRLNGPDPRFNFHCGLPKSLFPDWKKGENNPILTLKIEYTHDGSVHSRNFFGLRNGTMPPTYRMDKVATFAIRVFPAMQTSEEWPAIYLEPDIFSRQQLEPTPSATGSPYQFE